MIAHAWAETDAGPLRIVFLRVVTARVWFRECRRAASVMTVWSRHAGLRGWAMHFPAMP